ncbi:MAG: hypothetical protein JW832_15790 [Deltaproteobacteria bacterium]|nr:hypothetical protein [Deltaproteobacteria bacterium]
MAGIETARQTGMPDPEICNRIGDDRDAQNDAVAGISMITAIMSTTTATNSQNFFIYAEHPA